MTIQSINVENKVNLKTQKPQKAVAFKGGAGLAVAMMDSVERGGFAASFVVQDLLGMAIPRVATGLTRNSDETGKKNWAFATTEAIREILSGPSLFIIPSAILLASKKIFGSANDVPIDFIKGLGDNFAEFAKTQPAEALADKKLLKQNYYKQAFINLLNASTNNEIKDVEKIADDFTQMALKIDETPGKNIFKKIRGVKVAGSADDLAQELIEKYISIRKKHSGASDAVVNAMYKTKAGSELKGGLDTFLKNLRNYTNDVTSSVEKQVKKGLSGNVGDFVDKFNFKRIGSRFTTNIVMTLGLFSFFTIIPKLYKHKEGNPGLDGLEKCNVPHKKEDSKKTEKRADEVKSDEKAEPQKASKSQTAFTGLGNKIMSSNPLKKFAQKIEYDGFTMSMPVTMGMLYGATVLPRYFQAYDKHDKREILTRDLLSITAILFFAKSIHKAITKISSKVSGFALGLKPENHTGTMKKIWNHLNPLGGVKMLNNTQIAAKYSKLDDYKEGVAGFAKFIKEQSGDLKKVFSFDKTVKATTEKLLGKSLDKANADEIIDVLKKADKADLKPIYDVFEDPNNAFVKKAKKANALFGFVSTFVAVPAFMIWLQKFNEKTTKKLITKEQKEANKEFLEKMNKNNAFLEKAHKSNQFTGLNKFN